MLYRFICILRPCCVFQVRESMKGEGNSRARGHRTTWGLDPHPGDVAPTDTWRNI